MQTSPWRPQYSLHDQIQNKSKTPDLGVRGRFHHPFSDDGLGQVVIVSVMPLKQLLVKASVENAVIRYVVSCNRHYFIRYMKPIKYRLEDIGKVLSIVVVFDFNEFNTSSILLDSRGYSVSIDC